MSVLIVIVHVIVCLTLIGIVLAIAAVGMLNLQSASIALGMPLYLKHLLWLFVGTGAGHEHQRAEGADQQNAFDDASYHNGPIMPP